MKPGEGAITLSPSNIVDDRLDLSKCSYISWFKYNESPEIMVFEGDIVYAKTASIGKVAIVEHLPEKATINPQFVVLKDIKCDKRFLFYCLKSPYFKSQAESIVRGVAIPTLSQANLALLTIPTPSIVEQERIVAELDLLQGIIDKQKAQLKELDTLAQSIFYDMFGDPIVNDKRWPIKRLDEICENLDYLRKPITASEREKGIIPYYGASGIVDYVKDFIFDGDYLLVSEDGANLQMRHTPIAFSISGKSWVNNHAHVLLFSEKDTQRFIEHFIALFDISEFITGAVQPKLTQAKLNGIRVPLPPLSLQQAFATKIEAIEHQKASINASIAETQKLFDYMMDKYFG